MELIKDLENQQIKKRPKIKPGDVVSIYQEVKEGGKKRSQVFKGTVIKVRGESSKKTFTVRKISLGVGIERIYPLYLPSITKIKVLKSSKIRRAKLYYLRKKKGKAGRLKEKGVAEGVVKFLAEQEKEEALRQAQGKEAEKEKAKDESKEDKKEEKAKEKEGLPAEAEAKAGEKAQVKQKTENPQDKS